MKEWVLGVDVGSAWAVGASAAVGAAPEVLVVDGDRRVPCTVVLTEDGRLLAGRYAHRVAGRLPDRAERDPRRYVGRSPMLLGGTPVAAADALAALLALFVAEGRRRHDDRDPTRIALTHPAAWGPDRVAVLRAVATMVVPAADVVTVPEPVAVAAHHGRPGPLAVYDLGATSLDTAVVDGPAVVGTPGGDPDLGGALFDQHVLGLVGRQLAHAAPDWWEQLSSNPDRAWLAAAADLAEEARLAREALTGLDRTTRYVPGADSDVTLTRAELDDLVAGDVERSVALLARTIDAATMDAAPAGAAAVLVTGGAAVTPLVLARLRERFGERIVPVAEPQSAAALGATKVGATKLGATKPAAVEPVAPERSDVLARDVLDARTAAGRLFAWSVAADGSHRVARLDPRTGRAEREVALARLVGWVVADGGLVACERRAGGELVCRVLDPDLRTVAEVPLPTRYRPWLVADRRTAWAVLRSPDTRMTPGPGTGEIGTLAVQAFGFGAAPGPVQALGPAVVHYGDPGRLRIDGASPGTGLPVAAEGSCVIVVGRPPDGQGPRQALFVVPAAGPPVRLADRRSAPWLREVRGGPGRWWTAGAAGLAETVDPAVHGRVLLPGAATSAFAAGRSRFGVDPDGLHLLDGPAPRLLGRWSAVLGSPLAARAADAPAVRVDGDGLLLGVVRADGSGAVVRADQTGVRELAARPGRLEPVGRVHGTVLARHVPGPDGERPGSLITLR